MEATTSIPHGNKLNVIVTTLYDRDKKNKCCKVFGCNNNSIKQRNNFDFLFLEKQQKQQQKSVLIK